MSNPYRHPISTPVAELQGIASIAAPAGATPMENAASEQRAREAICEDVWLSIPQYLHKSIIKAMLTFSHTGVEQAIEACAKVAECAFDDRPHMGHDFRWHDGYEAGCKAAAAAIRATLPAQSPDDIAYAGAVQGEFQARTAPWMQECFGPEISADKLERNDRFIEESLELVQSLDYTAERAHALVDYVFGRSIGEPAQEVGGVMVTLAALCLASGLDMHDAGEVELARINRPEIIAKIRAKQAAKPTGSALPIAHPDIPAPSPVNVEGLVEASGLVPGPTWHVDTDDCWTSEIQVVGGYYVVATIYGGTEAEAIARRDATLIALASISPDGER